MEQTALSPAASKIYGPSVLQFVMSVFGLLVSWAVAAVLGIVGVANLLTRQSQVADVLTVLLLAAGLGLVGLALVPSTVYSFMDIIGRLPELEQRLERIPGGLRRFLPHPLVLVLVAALAIIAGAFIAKVDAVSWMFLPLLHILAVGLPVALLAMLALRGLDLGNPRRAWGVFAVGVIIGPFFIMIIEILLAVMALVAAIIYVAVQPDMQQELTLLSLRLTYAGQNPQDLLKLLRPYILQPAVIFSVLAFVAGLVPLVEELFKPIGAWLLVGQGLTPRSGFVAGAISGAGYALYENVMLSVMGDAADWSSVVTLRIGTALLHILTSAISGWGLGMAWGRGRYLAVGGSYLLAVLLHALWNAVSMAGSFSAIVNMEDPNTMNVLSWPYLVLGVLIVAYLALLVGWNRRVRGEEAGE